MTAARLTPAVLAALLAAAGPLAGCSKTHARPGLKLNGPSALAVYRGVTERDPTALRTYLAVANERGDDLRILDAVDGQAVLAPGLVQALSVPTVPRPALLASGGLSDGGADLLVVAPAGLAACDAASPYRLTGCLQVVDTWTPATAIAPALTLVIGDQAGADDDAEVLGLAVMPATEPDGAGGRRVATGRARVVVGLSGGRLLLAEYQRAAAGGGLELVGAQVHALGFDAVSISVPPGELRAWAASPDPIGGVEGVAELDLSGDLAAAPAYHAIPAGAPTTHVLAATVRPFVALGTDAKLDQFGPETLRVWAALEPARCGRTAPVTCGLAVLDPAAASPAVDPAGELPAHAPIAVSGEILGLAAVYPPSVGSVQLDGSAQVDGVAGPLQKQVMAAGERYVSTLAAVSTSAGAIVLVDLARGAVAQDRDLLSTAAGGAPARVITALSSAPAKEGLPQLGLWDERPGTTPPALTVNIEVLAGLVTMTPGYTPSEIWTVWREGELPGLSTLRGQYQAASGPDGAWVAVQDGLGGSPATPPYRGVARLYDPRLAIHVGDVVVLNPDDKTRCPLGTFELEVTGFLPPDADHPGGAVTVAPRPPERQPQTTVDGVATPADPTCLDGAGRSAGTVTFRSGGLVLLGSDFGYAGRPVAAADAGGAAFRLGWEDTSGLSCPLLDDPTASPAACGDACRAACERILLARKARRLFYAYGQCLTTDTVCLQAWGAGPLVRPVGPVLSFKAGWRNADGTAASEPEVRASVFVIGTGSGLTPSSRRPQSGSLVTTAVLPTGLATFDRAGATLQAADGVRVFGAYAGNAVLDFTPAAVTGAVTVHR